jgi:uncharacterized YigZ family protein
MDDFSYFTIQAPSRGLYKEKGSKFLAFAFPVESETEIEDRLIEVGRKYFDARHHCFAWQLGVDKARFRAFDDGEPRHSAGDPILGQIRSKNLTNVMIIVVRYFGGVKLGVGGLQGAYKSAASDAIEKATIIEKETSCRLTLAFDYAFTSQVMRVVNEFGLPLINQEYNSMCILHSEIRLRIKDQLLEKIKLLNVTGTPIEIEFVS